jgi:flagellar protein FlaG
MYSVAEAARNLAGPVDTGPGMDTGQLGGPAPKRQVPDRQAHQTAQAGRGSPVTSSRDRVQQPNVGALSEGERQELVTQIQEALEEIQHRSLQFSVDESTGKTVIKVVDKDTGEVIKEIPPEETLRLAEKIQEMTGILFDKKA